MRISENMAVYSAVLPQASKTSATETDAVSMKEVGNLSIVILTGDFGSPADTPAVVLRQSTAVAKTSEKALGFDFVYVGSSTDDTLLKTAVTSDTFNLAENSVYVIEVSDQELDVTNVFDCVHCEIAAAGQGIAIAVLILGSEMRTTVKTILTD